MESLIEVVQQFWAELQNGQVLELGYWTYIVLALCNMVQGPVVTLLGAAAASAGLLRPSLVFIASITGHLTADIVWYSLGHAGKIEWFSRLLPGYRKHIGKLKWAMRRNARKILFMAKFSCGLAVPALIAAGLTRVHWRRWFPIVLVSEVLWTSILMLAGYYATEAVIRRANWGMLALVMGFLVIFLLMLFLVIPRALGRNQKLSELAVDDEPR